MNSSRRSRIKQNVDILDVYAFKLGSVWGALKEQHLSFWMLCIYFFFEYVRPQTLYPSLDVLPWAQLSLAATLIAAMLDTSVRWVGNIENKLFLLFALIVIVSSVFSFRPSESLYYWSVFGSWFFCYFLVITVVNTEKRLILFMLAYCLFSFKMSQHGAIEWTLRGFSFTSYGLIGSPGYFRNSGEYAIQMLIFGSLAISIVMSLKDYWGRYKKWFYYAAAATGYMAVMGASSRGAQIALVIMAVWMMLKFEKGIKGLLVMALLSVVLFSILPEEQMMRIKEIGEDNSSLQRLTYWKYAFNEVIPKYPVLGLGYHNWLSYVSFKVPEGMGPYQTVQEPHNIYIQAIAELGYVGFSVFLMLILFAFVINRRTRKLTASSNNKLFFNLSYGLDAGLIGYLVAGSFVSVLYYPFFWVQIAMIVMLNSVVNKCFAESQPETTGSRRARMRAQH